MKSYFDGCKTAEEAKTRYRELAKQYHPDLHPGDNTLEIMKAINNQFEVVWARLKDVHASRDGGTYEATGEKRTHETAADFMGIINSLLRMDGLTVELCGRWIWIGGETRQHKDHLRTLGCRWANNKKMWYWHKAEDATMSRGHYSMEKIRDFYGSTSFNRKDEPAPALN